MRDTAGIGAKGSVATRTDDRLSIVEEVGFRDGGDGADGGGIFTVTYRPVARSVGAVLICPAVLSEYDHTYSTEVSLARALAARGFTVLRFHYRGTGHSDGAPAEMTYEGMCDDAGAALAGLAERATDGPTVVLGLRFGGLVAATTVARHATALLALWEPALHGRQYFRDAWRADLIFQINEGATAEAATARPNRPAFGDLLARDGFVDVLGYPICRPMHDSSVERALLEELGDHVRPVLIVRGGPVGSTVTPVDTAAETLRERGFAAEVKVLGDQLVWWFQGPNMRRWARPLMAELEEVTLAWIERAAHQHGQQRAEA